MMQCMQSMIIHDIGKRKSSYFLLEFINPKSNIYFFYLKENSQVFLLRKIILVFLELFLQKILIKFQDENIWLFFCHEING